MLIYTAELINRFRIIDNKLIEKQHKIFLFLYAKEYKINRKKECRVTCYSMKIETQAT
jgi:hypothetical protein